jgi:hypothetical protein
MNDGAVVSKASKSKSLLSVLTCLKLLQSRDGRPGAALHHIDFVIANIIHLIGATNALVTTSVTN